MDVISAHQLCKNHRVQIEASDRCGCFYCLGVFSPVEITEWVDLDTTALCPKCGIDSVIGSASSAPVSPEFLSKMNEYWF
ncbi:cytoplasmic protein [Pseudomonas syringae]|nr:cytoplasmic protein [Pseudomonas syringae]